VKREAEPEAQADPHGYTHTAGYSSAPVCTETPVKVCNPRQVETPRKVCQTVVDLYEDTVVTETCEEVVTTQCTHTSQTAHQTSAVVDTTSRLVELGVATPIPETVSLVDPPHSPHSGLVKRSPEAEPEPEADADAEADAWHHGYYAHPINSVTAPLGTRPLATHHIPSLTHHSAPSTLSTPPVCKSTPVKKCARVPTHTPRKVARNVCNTVVDVTTIEDCHETVTRHCQQTSTSEAKHSAVVAKETKVVADHY